MSLNASNDEDCLPVCAFCGSHGMLVDLREQAQLMGKTYPECDSPYVVICCGYFLAIGSEAERQKLIAHLKAKKEMDDQCGPDSLIEQSMRK